MQYKFSDIFNDDMYNKNDVAFIFGKYNLFINMVSDKFKDKCISKEEFEISNEVEDEFGLSVTSSNGDMSTSVDFNTFMEVNSVPNINGKWFCKVDLNTLTKKQKEKMLKYLKSPSENGLLVLVSNDWQVYREYLSNRLINSSSKIASIQVTFPYKETLIGIVKQLFEQRGMRISFPAIDMFIVKMSSAYDEYEQVIDSIREQHTSKDEITQAQLRVYMKGIEHFDIDDFLTEVIKPLSSEVVNGRKKVVKIMAILEDELGAKKLVYTMLNKINEMIDYRVLINKGIIPIGVKYFFKDVIDELGGKNGKYGKVNEWTFRKKAALASQTSLRDWVYMKIILSKAIENKMMSDSEIEIQCKKALYELCTRSVLTEDRINNIIGVSNILDKSIEDIDKIKFMSNELTEQTVK